MNNQNEDTLAGITTTGWDVPSPLFMAKTFTVMLLIMGWMDHQAPQASLRLFFPRQGDNKSAPVPPPETYVLAMQLYGSTVFAIGVLGYALFFLEPREEGTTTTLTLTTRNACGWYFAFWIVEHMRAILDGVDRRAGVSPASRYVWLPLTTLSTWSCWYAANSNSYGDWAMTDVVIHTMAALTIATGLPLATYTSWTLSLMYDNNKYDRRSSEDTTTTTTKPLLELDVVEKLMMKLFGYNLVSIGVMLLALVQGVDPAIALSLVNLFSFAKIFILVYVTKDTEKTGINMPFVYSWMVYHAIVVWIAFF